MSKEKRNVFEEISQDKNGEVLNKLLDEVEELSQEMIALNKKYKELEDKASEIQCAILWHVSSSSKYLNEKGHLLMCRKSFMLRTKQSMIGKPIWELLENLEWDMDVEKM